LVYFPSKYVTWYLPEMYPGRLKAFSLPLLGSLLLPNEVDSHQYQKTTPLQHFCWNLSAVLLFHVLVVLMRGHLQTPIFAEISPSEKVPTIQFKTMFCAALSVKGNKSEL
jgi:hypothetical protein